MFKKMMASLGVGAAKVDTVLEQTSVFQGESLRGLVKITGGDVEQHIDAITIKLNCEMKVESDDNGVRYQTITLGHVCATEPFEIGGGEERHVPFTLQLHDEIPVTAVNARYNQCKVWLETELDIDFALDPSDRDYIEIKPLPVVEKIISIIEQAGFEMVKADVESGYCRGNGFESVSGCYQELEFSNGAFLDKKEIELTFILNGNYVHCLTEIDRRFSGGDQYRSFTLSLSATEGEIRQALLPTLGL